MKLGIMQPYFFPYLGYFSLIKNTDKWVVFDTVQYINRGWINRNRILSQSAEGFSYITVPVIKQSRDTVIKNVIIDNTKEWKSKIIGQIDYYKKKAQFFHEIKNLVEEIFNPDIKELNKLNIVALEKVCNYLDIKFDYMIFSENIFGISSVNESDEWALEISKKMGASEYVNPPGGKSFFNKEKYNKVGIDLKFLTQKLKPYKTFTTNFIPGLSIIDVMMFNSPEQINEMMNDYEFE